MSDITFGHGPSRREVVQGLGTAAVLGFGVQSVLAAEGSAAGSASAISPPGARLTLESHYIEVLGSQMHYFDEGSGPVALFTHGNPTWSYQWRNVIPHVSGMARTVAVDLIGMGRSEKPAIDYTFLDHAHYLAGFIEAMSLENIYLVTHDWGTALAVHYAQYHADNVKGIVIVGNGFYLPNVLNTVASWEDLPDGVRQLFTTRYDRMRGYTTLMEENEFIEVRLPGGVARGLSETEMAYYREPYPTPASRKAVRIWPTQVPIAGDPPETAAAIQSLHEWLPTSGKPVLLLHSSLPQGVSLEETEIVPWLKGGNVRLETRDIGRGSHYITEDQPDAIGKAVRDWIIALLASSSTEAAGTP